MARRKKSRSRRDLAKKERNLGRSDREKAMVYERWLDMEILKACNGKLDKASTARRDALIQARNAMVSLGISSGPRSLGSLEMDA